MSFDNGHEREQKKINSRPLLQPDSSSRKSSGGWVQAIAAALPMLLLSYSSCVSYSQLIVADSPVSANTVTALHLLGSGITGVILPLTSRCPLITPSADISVTIFYQAVVKDVIAAAGADADARSVAATVMLALPFNTLLMSLAFYVIGQARLTYIIAYLPYPVVAGFLGTIGWSIFSGSFAVLAGTTVSVPSGLPDLAEHRPAQLACALVVPISTLILKPLGVSARTLALGPLVAAIVAFWGGAYGLGYTVSELEQWGWLFPMSDMQIFWKMWTVQEPEHVIWSAFPPSASTFFGLGLVLVLSLSLRTAGAEGSAGTILDMDSEMKCTGLANIGVGAVGGVIGSVSPGLVTLNVAAGSIDSRASLLTGGLTLFVWLSGLPIMNILPRFLLGGILMNLGITMLKEWMYTARKRLGVSGCLAAYVQVACAVAYGLLAGVLVGLAAACIGAWVSLLKLHALKYHVSGASLRSHAARTDVELKQLNKHSDDIQVFGLEGFLSFGPMNKLGIYVKEFVSAHKNVRFVILDFTYCQGNDPSTVYSLKKLTTILRDMKVETIFCSVAPDISEALSNFGSQNKIFAHREEALMHCEDAILGEGAPSLRRASRGRMEDFNKFPPPEDLTKAVAKMLGITLEQTRHLEQLGEWTEMGNDDILSTPGIVGRMVYIAAPGFSEVTEILDLHKDRRIPVAVGSFGRICGAESVIHGLPSSTHITISGDCSWILGIKGDKIRNLSTEDPKLFAQLSHFGALNNARRVEALCEWAKVSCAGGWKGAAFDESTASKALRMGQHHVDRLANVQDLGSWQSMAIQVVKRISGGFDRSPRKTSIEKFAINWAHDNLDSP